MKSNVPIKCLQCKQLAFDEKDPKDAGQYYTICRTGFHLLVYNKGIKFKEPDAKMRHGLVRTNTLDASLPQENS